MKYRVLNPIMQGVRLDAGGLLERQLVDGDTIEVDDKEAAELIACGAIAPEPITPELDTQSVAAALSSTSAAELGQGADTPGSLGEGQDNLDPNAGAGAAESLPATGKKKPVANKAAT